MIYLVTCDTSGAHESDDLMSVWTTRDAANAERDRLQALKRARSLELSTTYGGDFHVVTMEPDRPSNQPVNW